MKPAPMRQPSLRLAFIIFALALSASARPFDWQYSRLSAPFAVFYNPALLGNSSGYSAGFDARYADSADYDIRGAVIIPISKAMNYRDHLREAGNSKYFRYANQSYMSSKSAISVGAVYAGDEDYKVSAGFVTPVSLISTGVSVDLDYKSRYESNLSLNAAFAVDAPRLMRGGMLYLSFHNIAVSERDSAGSFGFRIGTAGIPFSDPRMFFLPYDVFFHFHTGKDGAGRVEGTARVNLDLTTIHRSLGTAGQAAAGGIGYNFTRKKGGLLDHKFFVTFGMVFMGKSSSAAFLGGYGESDEKYAAAFCNSFKKDIRSSYDMDLKAALSATETADSSGSYLFSLKSEREKITSWVLRIDDPRGASVKTFSGGSIVPSSVLWDGLDSQGLEPGAGTVFAKLVLKGESRIVESDVVEIELRKP